MGNQARSQDLCFLCKTLNSWACMQQFVNLGACGLDSLPLPICVPVWAVSARSGFHRLHLALGLWWRVIVKLTVSGKKKKENKNKISAKNYAQT